MTCFSYRLTPLLVTLFLSASAALAGPPTLRADKAHSSITYTCVHTLHEWSGVNRNVDAVLVLDPTTNQVTKVVAAGKVTDFDSGNSSRDSHGLEVMESIKYPKVTFVSNRVTPEGTGLKVEGNLTFHGITHPVAFLVTQQQTASELAYHGTFQVKLTDYGIDRPTFMLVPVEEEMKMELVMAFKR